MSAGVAILAPADVEQPLAEVNLIPAQRGKLADPERVARFTREAKSAVNELLKRTEQNKY
jgi:hypothetical protein